MAFVLALCWVRATAEPGPRSFPKIVDLQLGSGVLDLYWGPRGVDSTRTARQDLFVHAGNHIRIWWQSEGGFSAQPNETLRLPVEPGLVDFGDVLGDAGEEVVVLTRRGVFADRARELRRERSEAAGGIFGEGARASDPGGAFTRLPLSRRSRAGATPRGPGGPVPVPFSHLVTRLLRDIDGDGRDDLVVPRARRYEVYFRRGEEFVPAAYLEADHDVDVDPGGPELVDPLRFEVEVSELDFKDLNGDRLTDNRRVQGAYEALLPAGPGGFPVRTQL